MNFGFFLARDKFLPVFVIIRLHDNYFEYFSFTLCWFWSVCSFKHLFTLELLLKQYGCGITHHACLLVFVNKADKILLFAKYDARVRIIVILSQTLPSTTYLKRWNWKWHYAQLVLKNNNCEANRLEQYCSENSLGHFVCRHQTLVSKCSLSLFSGY